MPKRKQPRNASMQFWPRKRAKRIYARVRFWASNTKDPLLGFLGYKVGMTHLMGIDTRKNALTKGEEIFFPVTIIECPPLRIAGIRFYSNPKNHNYGMVPSSDLLFKVEKELARKIIPAKNPKTIEDVDKIDLNEVVDVFALIYTQPKLTGFGKKKPEFFEMGISGTIQEKVDFIKNNYNKELHISEFFKEGELVDIHAVTKGKGFQGPVKRFGVALRQHKSEKGQRGPGSLGGWKGHMHFMYRVAHAGQMGYHQRVEYNKQILKISTNPSEINPKGGLLNYGVVKTDYILIKGSVAGAKKRPIIFTKQIRNQKPATIPTITSVRLKSQ